MSLHNDSCQCSSYCFRSGARSGSDQVVDLSSRVSQRIFLFDQPGMSHPFGSQLLATLRNCIVRGSSAPIAAITPVAAAHAMRCLFCSCADQMSCAGFAFARIGVETGCCFTGNGRAPTQGAALLADPDASSEGALYH